MLKIAFGVGLLTSGVESATSDVASKVEIKLLRRINVSMPKAGVEDPLGPVPAAPGFIELSQLGSIGRRDCGPAVHK